MNWETVTLDGDTVYEAQHGETTYRAQWSDGKWLIARIDDDATMMLDPARTWIGVERLTHYDANYR